MRIDSLTDEQLALLPKYAKEWTDIGLCTDPADRPRAENAIKMMYEGAGLKLPEIVWTQSPLGNALTREAIRKGASVWDSVWDSVGASVGASVRDSVGASVRDSVWDSVGASVGDSVWDSVGDSVWESVGASVRDSVWDSVGASVRDSVGASVYGQHDAEWLAFYKVFHDFGLKSETKILGGLWELCQSAGWAMPHENICFISERHNVLKLDDRGVAHCEDGPAIGYPDGFEIYCWHGTRIPKEWIEDKNSITPDIALHHENVEQRRAACEIFGWARILKELNASTIDKSLNPFIGELVEVDIPDIGREKFLRVRCGTDREFALPVPPDMERATQAQAWLNFADEKYFTNDLSART